jgi:NAD(P)H-hydrate repair Nnr-like enzyme with NAD(P)H-hydrate epimerase domain
MLIRRLLTIPLAVALAAVIAGCGQTTIDQKGAETLARKIANSGQVKLKSVSCPSGLKAKKGADFDCKLEWADGAKGTITLHQLDDKGHVRTSGADIHVAGG